MEIICTPRQALDWTKGLEDELGNGIDPKMLRSVAALYRLGIKTYASCEGHRDRALPYPWIDIHPAGREDMQVLLDEHPLDGWTLFPEDPDQLSGLRAHRLLPSLLIVKGKDLGGITHAVLPAADSFSMLSSHNADLRAELLSLLAAHQEEIASWGEGLLNL